MSDPRPAGSGTPTLPDDDVPGAAHDPRPGSPAPPPLLEAHGLYKAYSVPAGLLRRCGAVVQAVDGVSLVVHIGRTLGLVGESGCGKSTLARLLLRLEEPDRGTLRLAGQDLLGLAGPLLRQARRRFQGVFQDAAAALNPRWPVLRLVGEGMLLHGLARRPELPARVAGLLDRVGLPATLLDRLPHQLSGGQRQRIGIARALALEPALLVLDEPTSALDLSVQAQILELLASLQAERGLAYLLISHDLRVVHRLADELAVMLQGRIVEHGPAETLLSRPQHPYTRALLGLLPVGPAAAGPAHDDEEDGQPRTGCPYRARCPAARPRCAAEAPELARVGEEGHEVRCFL